MSQEEDTEMSQEEKTSSWRAKAEDMEKEKILI